MVDNGWRSETRIAGKILESSAGKWFITVSLGAQDKHRVSRHGLVVVPPSFPQPLPRDVPSNSQPLLRYCPFNGDLPFSGAQFWVAFWCSVPNQGGRHGCKVLHRWSNALVMLCVSLISRFGPEQRLEWTYIHSVCFFFCSYTDIPRYTDIHQFVVRAWQTWFFQRSHGKTWFFQKAGFNAMIFLSILLTGCQCPLVAICWWTWL